jgi:hypothetical protein
VVKLAASLCGGEVPPDGGLHGVAIAVSGRDMRADGGKIRQSSIEPLAGRDRQLVFGVRSTAKLGPVVGLQLTGQSPESTVRAVLRGGM